MGRTVGWICCCCGCLPPLGILKAALFAPLPTLLLIVGTTLTAVICLPHDVYLSFTCVWSTVLLGRNLRAIILLLLPAMLLSWPLIVLFCSTLGGFIGLFCLAAGTVFDEDVPLWGGAWKTMKTSIDALEAFWELNWNSVFQHVADLSDIPRNWHGQVYDIPLSKVFVGIVLSFWGTMVGVPIACLLSTLKYPFALLRGLHIFIKEYFRSGELVFFLFWLCGLVGFVALSPVALCLCVTLSIALGPACAVKALRTDSIKAGFLEVFAILHKVDKASNKIIFDCDTSCIPSVGDSESSTSTVAEPPTTSAAMDNVWALASSHLRDSTKFVIQNSWLNASIVISSDPVAILGIPAFAVFQILHKSASESPGKQELHWPNDQICDSQSKPRAHIADVFWPRLMAAKRLLEKHLPLNVHELCYLQVKLCCGSAPLQDLEENVQQILREGEQLTRLRELHEICAELMRLSLQLSRLSDVQRILQNAFLSYMDLESQSQNCETSDCHAPEPQSFGVSCCGQDEESHGVVISRSCSENNIEQTLGQQLAVVTS